MPCAKDAWQTQVLHCQSITVLHSSPPDTMHSCAAAKTKTNKQKTHQKAKIKQQVTTDHPWRVLQKSKSQVSKSAAVSQVHHPLSGYATPSDGRVRPPRRPPVGHASEAMPSS